MALYIVLGSMLYVYGCASQHLKMLWGVRRSLLTQEGICLQLQPNFHFLEVAYPYVAKRLLTDEDPALRERLFQVPLPSPVAQLPL